MALSRGGRVLMGAVYFSVPVLGGLALLKWASATSERNFALREDEIRQAAPSAAPRIAEQNQRLRELLRDVAKRGDDAS